VRRGAWPAGEADHVFIEEQEQFATVTVANEFPDPAPAAQPLAASPTFTG